MSAAATGFFYRSGTPCGGIPADFECTPCGASRNRPDAARRQARKEGKEKQHPIGMRLPLVTGENGMRVAALPIIVDEGARRRMSRKGNWLDNVVVGNDLGSLK